MASPIRVSMGGSNLLTSRLNRMSTTSSTPAPARARSNRVHTPLTLCAATTAALAAVLTLSACSSNDGSADASSVADAAVTASPSSSSSTPAAAAVAPCKAHNLVGTIEQVQGAAGSTIIDVSLRNDGPSCTVAGFPGVSLIDVDGSQIGAAADREPASATPQSLTLATGDAASFSVRSTNALAFDPKECNTIDSTALKVYPPADTEWVTLPLTVTTCGNEQIHTLFTGMVG